MVQYQQEISAKETELIKQLRERVQNDLPNSITSMTMEDQYRFLVRWIRARDNHLDNATKMLRNSLVWRKEKNADEATKLNLHPFFTENYPFKLAGMDKKGQPVYLIPLAAWDFRKVINDAERLSEFDDFVTNFFEIICSDIRKEHLRRQETGHPPITQVSFVADVKNYSYGQLISFGAMKKLLQMASTYEAHYPEILFRGAFINCPSYFNLFMALVRTVIAPKTLGKLTCYSQMSDWQNDLTEFMDPEILPEQYGGPAKT